jgi:protein TonB
VSCPERTPPSYPSLSRRLGEEGTVLLRAELDEHGFVAAVRIASGSGHPRLDEAALAAIRTWRCTPAQRNGQPVRAVALQPFKFILQGN